MTERKKTGKTRCGCAADEDMTSAKGAGQGVDQKSTVRETPDANVDSNGHCLVPSFAETARIDTGEPCIDGLNWPGAGDDVPVSARDGSVEKQGGKSRKKS